MKIDYSKWIIVFNDSYGSSVSIENPSEGIKLWESFQTSYTHSDSPKLGDDPIKFIKELAKRAIKNYYLGKQFEYLNGKQIPVEDNLDYIENEAQKRGLI